MTKSIKHNDAHAATEPNSSNNNNNGTSNKKMILINKIKTQVAATD